MKVLFVLAAVLAAAYAVEESELTEQWAKFRETHSKTYKDDVEESFRKNIFRTNLDKINKHNALYERGQTTYKMGVNQFTDLLSHEVAETYNGYKRSIRSSLPAVTRTVRKPESAPADLPDSVDWRTKGAVTGVKNQGQCGSCWSFSTTGSLEGQLFKKTGKLVSLSEQNLVDCSYENDGCDGGMMDAAFTFIRNNGGIDTEASYPYEGVDWNGCRYSENSKGGEDTGFVDITSGDEEALKEAVANVGPISIAMDAALDSFNAYTGGIYYDPQCGNTPDDLDHGVLVVGYGSDGKDQDYWIVKNSWDTTWGEKGFFRLARNKNNHCGVATEASYPTV